MTLSEVFYKDWLVVIKDTTDKSTTVIVNDKTHLQEFHENNQDQIWVGYNSRHYDQWILKGILCGFDPYKISSHIIEKKQGGWSYSSLLHKVKLYNYDTMTSMHGLKQLEAFMGNNIKETTVPFTIKRKLTEEELQETIEYCEHDVEQTMSVFIDRIEEFDSHMALIIAFKLPLKYVNKSKAQLSAIILNAYKQDRNDEFKITIPETLKLTKYKWIEDWYRDPSNMDYKKILKVDLNGVPHVFAWGGLHGAIPNYIGEGFYLNVDVRSYYPSLMLEYDFCSRNIAATSKYREIYETRLRLKEERNKMQQPYKIVLNSTYGAMKDKYNALYDPLQANNVCVAGQLLLLDLIEKLEPHCQVIQSNTDGVLVKMENEAQFEQLKKICEEWEVRSKMQLEYETFTKVIQKDVNNYIIVDKEGKYKSKGAYVKKLNNLDNDLAIVNVALIEYFLNGVPVEQTINNCKDLKQFQKIVKVSGKYLHAMHGAEKLNDKVLRVFASRRISDGGIFKIKSVTKNGYTEKRTEKMANTPDRCFILNEDINAAEIPMKLDKKWYIEVANKRINDFING